MKCHHLSWVDRFQSRVESKEKNKKARETKRRHTSHWPGPLYRPRPPSHSADYHPWFDLYIQGGGWKGSIINRREAERLLSHRCSQAVKKNTTSHTHTQAACYSFNYQSSVFNFYSWQVASCQPLIHRSVHFTQFCNQSAPTMELRGRRCERGSVRKTEGRKKKQLQVLNCGCCYSGTFIRTGCCFHIKEGQKNVFSRRTTRFHFTSAVTVADRREPLCHELTELAANASDWCAWMWCTDASANHLPSFEAQSQPCEINPKVLSLFPFEPVIKHFFNHDSSLQLFLCW